MHDPSGYLKRPQASGLRSHPNWLHRCWRSTNKASNTCLEPADTSNCCAANWSSVHLIEVTWEGCDNVASRAPCKLLETVKSVEARTCFQTEVLKSTQGGRTSLAPPHLTRSQAHLSTGGSDDSITLLGPHQNHMRLFLRRGGTTKTAGSMHLSMNLNQKKHGKPLWVRIYYSHGASVFFSLGDTVTTSNKINRSIHQLVEASLICCNSIAVLAASAAKLSNLCIFVELG